MADYGSILVTIALLVVLEGLLSADNALVLAVLVRHLPKDQQKRALRYGIIGAFFFRIIAVLFASYLLEYWIFKVVGAFYLIFLAMKHFLGENHDDELSGGSKKHGFWRTVIGVELADIAFSIDSILAAVAMAEGFKEHIKAATLFGISYELLTVWIGGMLGIITMRYVAGMFIALLDKMPGLASAAYQLVLWIGIKLLASGVDQAFHLATADRATGWRSRLPKSLLDMHSTKAAIRAGVYSDVPRYTRRNKSWTPIPTHIRTSLADKITITRFGPDMIIFRFWDFVRVILCLLTSEF